jgi:ABC-type multidrug transport system fused ATPase/permease subunit
MNFFKDLDILAYGENTLVGEKGINLSGGQRARLNMYVFSFILPAYF